MINLSKINANPCYAKIVSETADTFVLDCTELADLNGTPIQKYEMFEGRFGRAFQQLNMDPNGDIAISQSWYNSSLQCCKDEAKIVILNKPTVLPGPMGYCQYSPARIPCSGEWCDGGSTAFGTRPCPDRAKFE